MTDLLALINSTLKNQHSSHREQREAIYPRNTKIIQNLTTGPEIRSIWVNFIKQITLDGKRLTGQCGTD